MQLSIFRHLFRCFVATICSVVLTSAAHAMSFDESQDGALVVTVRGEKLHFRVKDIENIWVDWPSLYDCRKERFGPILEKLSDIRAALNDPVLAECVNRRFPTGLGKPTGMVTLRVLVPREDGIPYLGVEDSKNVPANPRPPTVWLHIVLGRGGRLCTVAPIQEKDSNGFDVHYYPVPPKQQQPLTYSLPAEKRQEPANRRLCVSCGRENPGFRGCDVVLNSEDSSLKLYFGWVETYAGEDRWKDFDSAARKIADSIFADRPKGDLQ